MRNIVRLFLASSLACAPALANVIFTDTTFPTANYSGPSSTNDPAVTFSYGQCSSCGNPGNALEVQISLPNFGDGVSLDMTNSTFVFDPMTSGDIAQIDVSVDKNATFNQPVTGTNTFHPVIEQDGLYYVATVSGPTINNATSTGYETLSQNGLQAADFVEYDFATGTSGVGNPDFSGDPMTFGLAQISFSPYTGLTEGIDYDNLSINVITTPEPSYRYTLAFVLLAVVLLPVRKRRGYTR